MKNILNLSNVLLLATIVSCAAGCAKQESSGNTAAKDAASDKTCPDDYSVKFVTTQGDIIVDVKKSWAPLGALRMCELVREGYYTDVAFFRVIDGFIAQAGISGDPVTNEKWRANKIADDPVIQGNEEGTVTFAMGGPGTRTTQIFINLKDNKQLDGMGFAAIGKVRDMTTVRKLFSGYGEGGRGGNGPSQMFIQTKGNAYLKADFPKLDYIVKASIL